MPLPQTSKNRLAGLWGAYDHNIVKDKHFFTASDLAENFLEKYLTLWKKAKELIENGHGIEGVEELYQSFGYEELFRIDQELLVNQLEVRRVIYEWANRKVERITQEASIDTLRASIMFKGLYYSKEESLFFGTNGTGWKKKAEIAKLLQNYTPWSIDHSVAHVGDKQKLYSRMMQIVDASKSPTEKRLFEEWWNLTNVTDRPMLFPQVGGHTNGLFYLAVPDRTHPSGYKHIRLHFDFGLVNVITRKKIIIECDSRSYHSTDKAYQADRDRQNVAEKLGWSVRRFTYEDVMSKLNVCFANLKEDLFY